MTRLARRAASILAVGMLAVVTADVVNAQLTDAQRSQIDRGRYLVKISGCNDCHTEAYADGGGKVPESEWLKGSALGWRGPWGTTYATNLRLYFSEISEDEWVGIAKSLETMPPMPWFGVRALSEPDLRAMYRYIHHLGPGGKPAPDYLPPDKEPGPPFVLFPAPPPTAR
jgi:mono/diheme cytochrome c family protein